MDVCKLTDIAGEPRVCDTDLAVALGFNIPRQIRELIYRNRQELETFGNLSYRTTNSGRRGRPGAECHLNEPQALLVCMFSRTAKAADVRKMLIDVFMAWRAGKTVRVDEHFRRPPQRLAKTTRDGEFFEVHEHCFREDLVHVMATVPSSIGYRALHAWFDTL